MPCRRSRSTASPAATSATTRARSVLALRARRRFDLEEVDVPLDPALHARYGERIPVLALDGEELFEYFVDAACSMRGSIEWARELSTSP